MLRRVWTIAFDATNHFLAEDGWAIASHIALSALMSLFPFLIFVTAIAGFLGSKDLADEVARLIFSAWPAAVAGPIAAEVRDVLTAPRGGLLTVGAALALYFSSNAIEALRVGLDRAYACPETRPWWLLRLQSLAFMIVGAAALLGLALLVVLGPLIWATAVDFVPALAPMQGDGDRSSGSASPRCCWRRRCSSPIAGCRRPGCASSTSRRASSRASSAASSLAKSSAST